MANELDIVQNAFPVTLHLLLANVATNTTVDLALPGTNTGWVVPAGYKAHAVSLCAASNASLSAGQTFTFKVIDDGTELVGGPEAALTNATQRATGLQRMGVQPMAAASVVSVSVTSNTTGIATADVDAILSLLLTPA